MNQPKVVARIFGGLGNQMFCYAAARRLALSNDAELVIDDVSGFARDFRYQRIFQLNHFNIGSRSATPAERMEPFSRVRRYVKRVLNNQLEFGSRKYIQQEGMDFDPRLLGVKPVGTVYLEGYWQSEQYFKDVEHVIRQDLRIIPPKDELNQAMAERIRQCPAVAIHLRFFDAPQEDGINNAPTEYYKKAVAAMQAMVPGAHYFVFSDKPAAARSHLPLSDDQMTLVTHNEGDDGAPFDLWLMTQCRHFIIANSTFSWWGAWLGEHSDKKVIAPGFEMRSGKMWWGFRGLLPEEWIKL